MASLAATTPLARRQDPDGVVAPASICSDDQFKGGICQFFFLKDGENKNFADINRAHGISRITVIPHGSDTFNRQNARCVFRSSTFNSEICVSSNGSRNEAELSENGLNDVLDSVQCFVGRCEGDR